MVKGPWRLGASLAVWYGRDRCLASSQTCSPSLYCAGGVACAIPVMACTAASLCCLMIVSRFSAAALLVSGVIASAAAGAYPSSTSWGLSFVVALGHRLCTKDAMGSHSSQSSCLAVVYIRRYCSTHWFLRSDSPSVWGWKAVLILRSIFNLVVRALPKLDVKRGSLSVIILGLQLLRSHRGRLTSEVG